MNLLVITYVHKNASISGWTCKWFTCTSEISHLVSVFTLRTYVRTGKIAPVYLWTKTRKSMYEQSNISDLVPKYPLKTTDTDFFLKNLHRFSKENKLLQMTSRGGSFCFRSSCRLFPSRSLRFENERGREGPGASNESTTYRIISI